MLPDRPNLRHLKAQARDLLKAGTAKSVTDAQFQIARLYGFLSWPKLRAYVESIGKVGQLKAAIDRNDLKRVTALMTRHPDLHRAPMGYGKDGPLTWVAECRGLGGAPEVRLEMARWMIEHGSDVHQGGDGPLMRASLSGDRIPMMDLLVASGADVNAEWHGEFPMIFAPCEGLDPVALEWLLEHGANPNCARLDRRYPDTALDYVIGSYVRCSPDLSACIDLLIEAGGTTAYDVPAVLNMLRGRIDLMVAHCDADPALVGARFTQLTFGTTGGRMLTLRGSTLLHVAAEYGSIEAATLLLDRGADVNARALTDDTGVGGQTPIFHAATQANDVGLPMVHLLLDRGADLTLRVKIPGHYERPGEIVECTPLAYAVRFEDEPTRGDKTRTVALLRERGAVE